MVMMMVFVVSLMSVIVMTVVVVMGNAVFYSCVVTSMLLDVSASPTRSHTTGITTTELLTSIAGAE